MQNIEESAGAKQGDATGAIRPLFDSMRFTSVDGGYAHAVALDDHGKPYSWGNNAYGQLGIGNPGATRTAPQRIGTFTNALSISAGQRHTLLVADDGQLYGAGSATNGALGNDKTSGTVDTMSPVAGAGKFGPWAAVYSLSYTSLGLTRDNRLYSWGSQYDTASGTVVNFATPTLMFGTTTPFRSISAGDRFCAVVDMKGDLYLWGNNNGGQCSPAGTFSATLPDPARVTALPAGVAKFSMAAAGLTHGLAVDESRTSLWAWGSGPLGQLGLGSARLQTGQMAQVALPAGAVEIVKIFATINQSAALIRMSSGAMQVAAWGLNTYGQTTGMGVSDETRIYTPATTAGTLDYSKWFAMGLGYDFVLAITA